MRQKRSIGKAESYEIMKAVMGELKGKPDGLLRVTSMQLLERRENAAEFSVETEDLRYFAASGGRL